MNAALLVARAFSKSPQSADNCVVNFKESALLTDLNSYVWTTRHDDLWMECKLDTGARACAIYGA
jgi:hypothetical protein